jgi:hypothetical protein
MRTPSKNPVLKAVTERVLPQQVPDAEMLTGPAASERFGLPHDGLAPLPDIVAWSKEHDALFFIQVVQATGAPTTARHRALERWSDPVKCSRVFVWAYASRKAYAVNMGDLVGGTYIWFADEPKHFAFISGSAEASERFGDARTGQVPA